ncbi:antitoxin Xre-like helix-turn-helix domain-containing protein [Terasakiella sp. SH-1]|uniref:antitoxin Xre-like helix-turn-helix domain-containing protein n=1 Tax=Terasakiella sp. SH-1 TaxID=2560057 RepID=UPI00107432D7|nr:antitoxin Xre-like helix-turn-helix domain-containing protein [Terasakiella sp. SH-1]
MSQAFDIQTSTRRKQLSASALKAFFQIARLWQLSNAECITLLGLSHSSTFYRWRKSTETARLKRDTLERISHILAIYKALQILLPNHQRADSWIRENNKAPIFANRPALDRMLAGNVADLFVVRRYLETHI